MKKTVMASVVALGCALGLSACGGDDGVDVTDSTVNTTAAVQSSTAQSTTVQAPSMQAQYGTDAADVPDAAPEVAPEPTSTPHEVAFAEEYSAQRATPDEAGGAVAHETRRKATTPARETYPAQPQMTEAWPLTQLLYAKDFDGFEEIPLREFVPEHTAKMAIVCRDRGDRANKDFSLPAFAEGETRMGEYSWVLYQDPQKRTIKEYSPHNVFDLCNYVETHHGGYIAFDVNQPATLVFDKLGANGHTLVDIKRG